MSDKTPEFIYDDQSQEVLIEYNGRSSVSYSDIERDSYETLVAVNEFVTQSTTLIDDLLEKTTQQVARQQKNVLLSALPRFQKRVVDDYEQCLQLQQRAGEAKPHIAEDLRKLLFKNEKLLKHYFRVLSIAQHLGISYRLGFHSLSENQLHLYSFVQNVCSTIEYLGQAVENRMGEGRIDLKQSHWNAVDVYQELKNQEIADPRLDVDDESLDDTEVIIPPRNVTKYPSELPLSMGHMRWLWEKRCQIVHNPPLIVAEERTGSLPKEIISSHIFTENDMKKLTELSFRLHLHSTLLFIKYLSTYMDSMLPPMVEILYPEHRKE
jgi:hypothetical protein